MKNLTLSLLGFPLLERDGHRLHIERHKSLALLVYLAVSGPRHQRDELAALFWPEYDQSHARAALRRDLSSLNIALAGNLFQSDRETIGISSSPDFSLDITRFHELLSQCRMHGHPEAEICRDCLPPLQEAAALYRGDFLSGFSLRDAPAFDDWQVFQAETLRGELAGVLERLARGYRTTKDYDAAIGYARRWVTLDPLQEPAQCELMRLYAWAGQRNAALHQYNECARLLEHELGIPPQAETTGLFQAIRDENLPAPGPEFPLTPGLSTAMPRDILLGRQQASINLQRGQGEAAEETLHATSQLLAGIVRGPLVGREHELAEAQASWERAATGEGQVLFISGEPGVGKTRLTRELVGFVQAAGGQVLSESCHPEGGPPYAPLAAMIRNGLELSSAPNVPDFVLADLLKLAPHLKPRYPQIRFNPTLDPKFEQQRMFDSFVTWCEDLSSRAPLLLVVEDVHWTDPGTLALVLHLARRATKSRLLLVLTYRAAEVELDQAHPLHAVLLDLNRERLAVHLHLNRLNREQTGRLLDSMLAADRGVTPEFLDGMYTETEGNPFFIEEVCKGLIEQGKLYRAGGIWRRADMQTIYIPPTVREAIAARVDRLPAATQEALRLAAILGREFDLETLLAVGGQDEDALVAALEWAERAELISETSRTGRTAGPPTFSFAHAIIPFALRETLGGFRRQQLHQRAGTALEHLHPNEVEALAYHFSSAGKRRETIEYSRRAASRAAALYAYEAAIQYLQTALDWLEETGQPEIRSSLLEELADAEGWHGNNREALLHYQQALSLLPVSPRGADRWTAVRLYRKMGDGFNRLTLDEQLEPFNAAVLAGFENGLQLIQGEPPHPESVRLLTSMAIYGYWTTSQHYEMAEEMSARAEQYARTAVTMATELDAPDELSAALEALGSIHGIHGMLRERLDIAFQMLAVTRDPRFTDRRQQVGNLAQLGLALSAVGEYEQALPHLLQAEKFAEEIHDLRLLIYVLEIQAQCLFNLDRWDEIARVEDKGEALQRRYGRERVGRICRQCGVSAYVHGLRGEMELSRSHREAAYQMMANAWGPLENWPSIGHF